MRRYYISQRVTVALGLLHSSLAFIAPCHVTTHNSNTALYSTVAPINEDDRQPAEAVLITFNYYYETLPQQTDDKPEFYGNKSPPTTTATPPTFIFLRQLFYSNQQQQKN